MRGRTWAVLGTGVVATGLVAGGVLAIGLRSSAAPATPARSAGSHAGPSPTGAVSQLPAPPLRIVSVQHDGAAGAITVTFSAAVGATVTPTLSPALAGSWSHPTATVAVFTPTQSLLPLQSATVTVPAGTAGIAGGRLAAASTTTWHAPAGSPLRLQQLLGETGYLPLAFSPRSPEPRVASAVAATASTPVAGSYAWRFAAPASLRALYTGGSSGLLTHGGVLAFQSAHHLAADGDAGPQVWSALARDAATRTVTTRPYTYVLVSKHSPETLSVYRGASLVLTTHVNTGVAGAPTPDGSWAVFSRYPSQTMSGTNPDGSHYTDPGVPWISYFYGGDAVHGFPRASYGSPQSVGCVELPIATAKTVYSMLDYGDIVTVQG